MLLPPNTQALHKVTLPGTYLLNVTDLVDIGVSLHSLLQVATATPPPVRHVYREGTPATDQLKFPRAMLKLTLTDGVQDVQAMEYKPLPALSMNSLLGLKILVKAPRVLRGVMLLEPDNVEIFGGAVPELYGSDLAAEVTRRLKPRLKTPLGQEASSSSSLHDHGERVNPSQQQHPRHTVERHKYCPQDPQEGSSRLPNQQETVRLSEKSNMFQSDGAELNFPQEDAHIKIGRAETHANVQYATRSHQLKHAERRMPHTFDIPARIVHVGGAETEFSDEFCDDESDAPPTMATMLVRHSDYKSLDHSIKAPGNESLASDAKRLKRNLSPNPELYSFDNIGGQETCKRRGVGSSALLSCYIAHNSMDTDDGLSVKQENLDPTGLISDTGEIGVVGKQMFSPRTILEADNRASGQCDVGAGNRKTDDDEMNSIKFAIENAGDVDSLFSHRHHASLIPSTTKPPLVSNEPTILSPVPASREKTGSLSITITSKKEEKSHMVISLPELKRAMSLASCETSIGTAFVKASITRLGQLKLTPTKGYMLVAYVTDGSGVEQCSTSNLAVVATSEIPVLLGNKIVTELMELNHTELIAIKKTEGDKSVGRYFGRLRDKVVGVEALLELDITSVTSVTPAILRKSFNGIRTKTALGETASRDSIETPVWAPLVVGYEKTSPLGCHTE